MERRLFVALTAAASVSGVLKQAHADEHAALKMHSGWAACAKACSECQRFCASCTAHCTAMVASGKKDHLVTLKSCQDCAEVCAVTANIMARGGPYAKDICKTCMEVCAKCATECEKLSDDEHMKACAAECRKCEKACKDMLAM